MKTFIFTLFLSICLIPLSAQIQNGGFEQITPGCFQPAPGQYITAFEDGCVGNDWGCFSGSPDVSISGQTNWGDAFAGNHFAHMFWSSNPSGLRESIYYSGLNLNQNNTYSFSMKVKAGDNSTVGYKVIATFSAFANCSTDFYEPFGQVLGSGSANISQGWISVDINNIVLDDAYDIILIQPTLINSSAHLLVDEVEMDPCISLNNNWSYQLSGTTSGTNYTMTGTAAAHSSAFIHSWGFFQSNSPSGPYNLMFGTSTTGPTITASPFVFGKYYKVTHKMLYANGDCSGGDAVALYFYVNSAKSVSNGKTIKGKKENASNIESFFETHPFHDGISELTPMSPTIYPNPANDNFFVEIDPAWLENSTKVTATIYDLTGREIVTKAITSPKQNMETTLLNTGVYIIRITTSSGSSFQQKVSIVK